MCQIHEIPRSSAPRPRRRRRSPGTAFLPVRHLGFGTQPPTRRTIVIRLTNNASARLRRIAATPILPALGEELLAAAAATAEDAKFSIHDGAISGSGHVPSAPFDPPNNDTGELADSIVVGDLIETPGQIQTSVIVGAEHGLYLELGTSRMLPRPFLQPATERQRIPLFEALVARVRQITGA